MKQVKVYTDGACLGNPGPGGWAAILIWGPHRKELSGGEAQTTNNRMELRAAIEALKALKEPAEVDIYTDSIYLARGVTEWLSGWKERGWKRRDGATLKTIANVDLWQELAELLRVHRVHFHWVAGHSGDPENAQANVLARAAMRAAVEKTSSGSEQQKLRQPWYNAKR